MHVAIDRSNNLWILEQRGVDRVTPQGKFTLYPTPVHFSLFAYQSNQGILAEPSGNVWFIDGLGHVGEVTPAGVLKLYTPPAALGAPFAIARTPDGKLWSLCQQGDIQSTPHDIRLAQVTEGGSFSLPPLRLPAAWRAPQDYRFPRPFVYDLVAAPDGTLWYAEFDSPTNPPPTGEPFYLGAINPRTGEQHTYPLLARRTPPWWMDYGHGCEAPDCYVASLTVTRAGAVWLASQLYGFARASSTRAPGQADGTQYTLSVYLPDAAHPTYSSPEGISVAPDDTILYFDVTGYGYGLPTPPTTSLCRVALSGRTSCKPLPYRRATSYAAYFPDVNSNVAFDASGAGWFGATCTDDIGRIAPDGGVSYLHIPGTAPDAGDMCPRASFQGAQGFG